MTKVKRFIYNGTVLTFVGFAMRGVALFLGAYISSAIGAEGIGLQGLIATVYSFAVTFATSGASLSVTRLVAASIGEGRGSDRILRGAFLYALGFGLLATAVLFLFSDMIGVMVLGDTRIAAALRILSLSLLPIALSGVISGYFVAVRRVAKNAAVQICSQIMRVVLTVFLLGRASLQSTADAILALAVGSVVTESVCFLIAFFEYVIDRIRHRGVRESGCGIGDVSSMALPLAFSAYVRSFLLSVEHSLIPRRLIKSGNSKEEALASYGYLGGMALPIILFPMTPLSSFSGLLVPEFAESEGSGQHARMERMARLTVECALAYATVVGVFIFAFSEELGYVIYGTYEAGRYIGLLAPVIPIMYLDHVTDSMLKGIGEQVYSMWVNIADSLLSVFLVFILIPIFDISGYAIVIIAMEAFNFSLSYLRLKKRIRFSFNPWTAFLLPLASSAAAITLAKGAFIFVGRVSTAFWLIMQILFGLCVFFAIITAVKMLKYIRAK